ncbi:MAG: SPOR domain-containing protein [Coxiellaceae bacterium]|nr:SPOR domain-containing protein [Coxiellaceae bacterium]
MLNKYYYGRNIIPIISEPKAAAPSNITATKVISTPKFDFYNTLQQKEDLRKTKKPDDAYELEIAILDNFAAADRLKAELALLGFPASITPIYKQGIQKYYISTGPYDNKENAIIDAQKLKQNHIKSNLKKYLKSSLY